MLLELAKKIKAELFNEGFNLIFYRVDEKEATDSLCHEDPYGIENLYITFNYTIDYWQHIMLSLYWRVNNIDKNIYLRYNLMLRDSYLRDISIRYEVESCGIFSYSQDTVNRLFAEFEKKSSYKNKDKLFNPYLKVLFNGMKERIAEYELQDQDMD